ENFTFIGQIMNAPGAISVAADGTYETLEDLLEAAKQEERAVGNSGAGSIREAATHGITGELRTKVTPVPYDGGGAAVAAAAAGEAAAAVSGAGEALAQGEEVRVLGVLHEEGLPDLPDTPTFKDAVGADLQYGGWGGIYTAADLPQEIRDPLEKAVKDAVDS